MARNFQPPRCDKSYAKADEEKLPADARVALCWFKVYGPDEFAALSEERLQEHERKDL